MTSSNYIKNPIGQSTVDYLLSNTAIIKDRKNFRVVKKPLKAFKKVYADGWKNAIANLIIPEGAIIRVQGLTALSDDKYSCDTRKMRASMAKVHSIVSTFYTSERYSSATSGYASAKTLVYRPGQVVIPHNGFSFKNETCEPGIHFFLNVEDAVNY